MASSRSQAAYQQIPTDELTDNSGMSINSLALLEPVVDPSFGDGGTKRSLQERQWVIFHSW